MATVELSVVPVTLTPKHSTDLDAWLTDVAEGEVAAAVGRLGDMALSGRAIVAALTDWLDRMIAAGVGQRAIVAALTAPLARRGIKLAYQTVRNYRCQTSRLLGAGGRCGSRASPCRAWRGGSRWQEASRGRSARACARPIRGLRRGAGAGNAGPSARSAEAHPRIGSLASFRSGEGGPSECVSASEKVGGCGNAASSDFGSRDRAGDLRCASSAGDCPCVHGGMETAAAVEACPGAHSVVCRRDPTTG